VSLETLIREASKSYRPNRDNRRGKVLFATSISGNADAANLDRVLALGVALRGSESAFLLCDSDLSACQIIKFGRVAPIELIQSEHTPRCGDCASHIESHFVPLGMPYWRLGLPIDSTLSQQIDSLDSISQIREFNVMDCQIGDHAYAATVRYFASTQLHQEAFAIEIAKRYLKSAARGFYSALSVFDNWNPDVVVAHHGIYVPQGPIVQAARLRGIRVLTWTPSYRRGTFIFSEGDSYHHTMLEEPSESWANTDYPVQIQSAVDEYMTRRERGEDDWITFSDSRPSENQGNVKERSPNFVLALTSVTWDAEVHYQARAFRSMRDWLAATVAFYQQNKELRLVIRIHPAELTSPNRSREPMHEYLEQLGTAYCSNIEVVGPESKESTYDLIRSAQGVVVFNTKAGIEAAYREKPVVVAGEAWIKHKGFTIDVDDSEEYWSALSELHRMGSLSPERVQLAKKYATHFFFSRMVRLNLFSHEGWPAPANIESLFDGSLDPNLLEVLKAVECGGTPCSRVW